MVASSLTKRKGQRAKLPTPQLPIPMWTTRLLLRFDFFFVIALKKTILLSKSPYPRASSPPRRMRKD